MVATQSGVNGESAVFLVEVGKGAVHELALILRHSSMGRTAMVLERLARRRNATRTSAVSFEIFF